MRTVRRAFSMIELLVVIAIVAIISGILLPAFQRARASALESSCLSNLGQIGIATHLYLNDYDDHFPFAISDEDRISPPEQLRIEPPPNQGQALLDYELDHLATMPTETQLLLPFIKNRAIFHCPEDNFALAEFGLTEPTQDPTLYTRPLFDTFGTSYHYVEVCGVQSYSELVDPTIEQTNWDMFPFHNPLGSIGIGNSLYADGHVKNHP